MSFWVNHFHKLERVCSPVCFEGRLEWDVVKRPGRDRLHPTPHFHVDVEPAGCSAAACSALPCLSGSLTDKCQISSSHWSGYQQDRLHWPMGRQKAGITKYGSSRGLCFSAAASGGGGGGWWLRLLRYWLSWGVKKIQLRLPRIVYQNTSPSVDDSR